MALVRAGNTANEIVKTRPTIHGNTPILIKSSLGSSIVVLSFNISTVASAGILTAGSFGVMVFKKKKTMRVIPVNKADDDHRPVTNTTAGTNLLPFPLRFPSLK